MAHCGWERKLLAQRPRPTGGLSQSRPIGTGDDDKKPFREEGLGPGAKELTVVVTLGFSATLNGRLRSGEGRGKCRKTSTRCMAKARRFWRNPSNQIANVPLMILPCAVRRLAESPQVSRARGLPAHLPQHRVLGPRLAPTGPTTRSECARDLARSYRRICRDDRRTSRLICALSGRAVGRLVLATV